MKLRHRFITAASVLALAGAGMRADAQIIMSYAVDSPQLSFIWQNTDKFDVLDSTYLTVTYSLRYRSSETDDSLSNEDLMDLQMGRAYNAFFSRHLRETDTKNTESINTHMYFAAGYERSFVGFDLLFGHEDGTLTQKSAPIIRYDWDRRKMKKDEWRKYERRIYEQAGVFARSTGARILIVDDGPQGSRRLSENDNWSEYHITLER